MTRTFTVHRTVSLDAAPAQVWEAIATGPGLAGWFMPMEIDPTDPSVTGWQPPTRLAIRTPTAEDGSTDAFDYLVEEHVADYVTPTYLGVRTADALVRCHGRAALGLPIAEAVHRYGAVGHPVDDTDTGATAGAWRSWLARVFPAP